MLTKSLSVSYIDFLWALSAVFLLLFLVAKSEEQKGNIIDPSQFIAEMTWGEDSANDIDLWIENPNGDIVYFGTREMGGMTLDTDNLGINNTFLDAAKGEYVTNKIRREVASIRKPIAGTYTINVMKYADRTGLPEKVKVHVSKLNPYSEVIDKEVTLNFHGEEATIITFELDEDGKIVTKNVDPEQVSLFGKLKP